MRRLLLVLGALVLLGGAVFAAFVGGVVNWLACENEGTPACERQDLAVAQYVVAIVGIVPALALVAAAALQKRRLAMLALAVGVPTYLAWAVLLDAAEHGWDDLTLLA